MCICYRRKKFLRAQLLAAVLFYIKEVFLALRALQLRAREAELTMNAYRLFNVPKNSKRHITYVSKLPNSSVVHEIEYLHEFVLSARQSFTSITPSLLKWTHLHIERDFDKKTKLSTTALTVDGVLVYKRGLLNIKNFDLKKGTLYCKSCAKSFGLTKRSGYFKTGEEFELNLMVDNQDEAASVLTLLTNCLDLLAYFLRIGKKSCSKSLLPVLQANVKFGENNTSNMVLNGCEAQTIYCGPQPRIFFDQDGDAVCPLCNKQRYMEMTTHPYL